VADDHRVRSFCRGRGGLFGGAAECRLDYTSDLLA
jgi:hypothetical protein